MVWGHPKPHQTPIPSPFPPRGGRGRGWGFSPSTRLWGRARAVRLFLALTVASGLATGVVTVLQAYLLSRVVARVFLEGSSLSDVEELLLALVAAIVVRAGLAWAKDVFSSQAAIRIKSDLREELFARLLALGPAYTSGERTGELANTAIEGIESLDAYFSQYLPNLALAALVPLTLLVCIFPQDLVSALVFLVTAPLIPLFMILIGKLANLLTRRQWESLSRMSAHFLDVLQGLTTLKLFGRSRAQLDTIARISDRFRETTMGVLKVAFLSALTLELLASVSTAVVAVEVGLRLLYATISFEQAFFVLILAPELYLPLRSLAASFHAGMSGAAAARRLFEVLDSPVHPVHRVHLVSSLSPSPRSAVPPSVISFRDVHYAYDGGERPALRGVSLQIEQGQRVALVGPSGSGKSTVAGLLLRFFEPDRGEILVDGTPLHDLPPRAWRELVAWVPQTPYLFNASVADNLRLARPAASAEQLAEAAKLAGADQFIANLPRGYDTVIGERGARLSGGEVQRLALARAFLRDAPLLILDEAVSNLDAEMEARVQETVEQLMQGRTALIIAHRLGTVRTADRVVLLDGGRVAASGSHQTLLREDALYRRMVVAYGGET